MYLLLFHLLHQILDLERADGLHAPPFLRLAAEMSELCARALLLGQQLEEQPSAPANPMRGRPLRRAACARVATLGQRRSA